MIIRADARYLPLADQCVHCCVTSPPYWGLRKYPDDRQIGLEPTLEAYVQSLVQVFREVWHVLREDGTVWLNLGDTYSASCSGNNGYHDGRTNRDKRQGPGLVVGLKPKDLVGIPWRVAFALQADGWYLRSDIIWSKPNPMPESVQGTHYSRHRVTIDEYERLSGLRYACECAGDAWAGDMPPLSEGEVSHRKAPLSAEPERYRRCSCEGSTRGRAGETQAIQPITIRPAEQSQVRGDGEGQTNAQEGNCEVSCERQSENLQRRAAPSNQGRPSAEGAATNGESSVPENAEREGAQSSPARTAQRRDFLGGQSTDGGGLGGDRAGSQGAVLLLQETEEANHRPCDSTSEGRLTHQDEHRAGVPVVQFQETRSDRDAVLVGCPGCQKCIQHHGYIFHLSAGRPTKAHEFVFLLAKSERYYYDAKAIAEPASPETWGGFETGYNSLGLKDYDAAGVQNPSSVKARIITGARKRALISGAGDSSLQLSGRGDVYSIDGTRNKRSVWSVPTMPYVGAHFATMPEALVEPCIVAGCPLGGLVLDPFCGTGTVLAVAARTGRRGVGIDLSYQELAKERTAQRGLMFGASASC